MIVLLLFIVSAAMSVMGVAPGLSFIPPSPTEEATTGSYVALNVSTGGSATYVFFRDDLVAWYRLDNDSSVGEDGTIIHDWSGIYGSHALALLCEDLAGNAAQQDIIFTYMNTTSDNVSGSITSGNILGSGIFIRNATATNSTPASATTENMTATEGLSAKEATEETTITGATIGLFDADNQVMATIALIIAALTCAGALLYRQLAY